MARGADGRAGWRFDPCSTPRLLSRALAPLMTWSDWPPRRKPISAVLAVVVILAVTGSIAVFDPWLGALGCLLMLNSCAEVLLPSHFALDEKGIRVNGLLRRLRRPWHNFASWTATDEGYWLQASTASSLIARRRSLLLRCPDCHQQVASLLARHINPTDSTSPPLPTLQQEVP